MTDNEKTLISAMHKWMHTPNQNLRYGQYLINQGIVPLSGPNPELFYCKDTGKAFEIALRCLNNDTQ